MNKALIAFVIILILGLFAFLFFRGQSTAPGRPQPQQTQSPSQKQASQEEFIEPKKSAHYESNTPQHGSVLAGVPINVVINFNFDLVKGSEIKITKDGIDYEVGETIIDKNKLAMRRKMDPNSPDGLYTSFYKACWADGSCHDGQFQFKIDRSSASDFSDVTGKKEVKINLQNTAFSPAKVKVSKGTRVTWENLDSIVHTVNTDSHPAHTYYLNQNSQDLKKGDIYSVTFDESGIYLYHCTPHAAFMHGQILVE